MRTRLLILALLVIGVLIGCQQGSWKEVNSREGAFSILFPGTPTEKTQQADIANETIYMHIFLLQQKDSAYSVRYNDYPESIFQKKDANKILDDMRSAFVSKGTLLN